VRGEEGSGGPGPGVRAQALPEAKRAPGERKEKKRKDYAGSESATYMN